MNNNPLKKLPRLSTIIVHQTRSLFDIERLVSLYARAQPKLALVRIHHITRWNE